MNRLWVVAGKEFRGLVGRRGTVLTALFFSALFGGMSSLGPSDLIGPDIAPGGPLFYYSILLGVFLGFLNTGQVFLREKLDAVIETLLCSPAGLRELWLGKTLAVTLFAYVFAVGAAVLSVLIAGTGTGVLSAPGGALMLHLFVALPLVIASLVGALGFSQLLLGMKENRVIELLLFTPLLVGLYTVGYTSTPTPAVGLTEVAIIALMAILILLLLTVSTRFLSRERIVTSVF